MIDTANFFGYVLWSVWLVAFGVVILVHERRRATASAECDAPGRGDVHDRPRDSTARHRGKQQRTALAPHVLRLPARRPRRRASSPARSTGSPRRSSAEPSPASILGAVQSWGMGTNGPPARRWIAATGVGFAVGLALGAAAVGYGTSLGDLVVQGAICGLAIGIAQAIVLRGLGASRTSGRRR